MKEFVDYLEETAGRAQTVSKPVVTPTWVDLDELDLWLQIELQDVWMKSVHREKLLFEINRQKADRLIIEAEAAMGGE